MTDTDELEWQLECFGKAYPEEIFPEVGTVERAWLAAERPGMQDRIAASMGRHFAGFAIEAAAALRALRAERDEDVRRVRDEARANYVLAHARAAERDQECFRLEDELKGALELINAQNANAATLREMFGQAKERALNAEFAIAACARFLKEGETPAQRIERLHGEISGMMKTLAVYTDRALAAEATLAKQAKEIAKMLEVLKPFANCIFNDNGDITVSFRPFTADELTDAYFASRRARSLAQGETT